MAVHGRQVGEEGHEGGDEAMTAKTDAKRTQEQREHDKLRGMGKS